MTFKVYAADEWKNPFAIKVYDGDWQDVQIAYVYNLGIWHVVFPEPIIPAIEIITGPIVSGVGGFSIDFQLLQSTNAESVVAKLYLGTDQSTLVETQTAQTDPSGVDTLGFLFTGLINNQTYNYVITAYSITENTAQISGQVTVAVDQPTVNITLMSPDIFLNYVDIYWSSTYQYAYRIDIFNNSTGALVYTRSLQWTVGVENYWRASFNLSSTTTYRVEVSVQSAGELNALDTDYFVSPATPSPTINYLTVTTLSCSSIQVSWSVTNYTSATLYFGKSTGFAGTGGGGATYLETPTSIQISSGTGSQIFNNLLSGTEYGASLVASLTGGTDTSWGDESGPYPLARTETSVPSPPNAPTITGINWVAVNLVSQSGYLLFNSGGENCNPTTGYRLEYKQTGTSSWAHLTAFNSSTGYFVGPTYNTSYDFRLFALSSSGDSAASNTFTSTSPNVPAPTASSFTSTGATQTSISLGWSSSNQTSYEIRDNATNTLLVNGLYSSSTSASVTNLSIGISYTFKLIVFNAAGNTASTTTTASTLGYVRSTCSITSITNRNTTGFTVNWSSTNQSYYRIRVLQGTTQVVNTNAISGSSTRTYNVAGLTHSTSYTVELTVWSNDEYNVSGVTPSESSTTTSTTTPPAATLSNVSMSLVSGKLKVTWSSTYQAEYRVRIYYKSDLTSVIYQSNRQTGTVTSWTSPTAATGHTYRASVELWNAYGVSTGLQWSGDVQVT